ncbi:hypothetical protein FisN_4Lh573 [Fistulifera solaris]|uniref:C2 domain-containing protein n=1 Tax=Fistulifera solaris TaxID=1519565 RepID=A0A1Z5KE32_FISSO|nr:hypothetical protein FisN_4Lh573 [Fistulifera solaris]|eukprot:GAX24436.1 hypothetical protein FisN_4Lh573 [Fistulifera solaris]
MEESGNRVRLELHASKLKGSKFGKSAPFAVVILLSSDPRDAPVILGRTKAVPGTLNPHWTEVFQIDYEIGQETRVNIGVYDELSKKEGVNKPMGSAVFEIGDVLGARGNTKAKKLRQGGTLFARVTEYKATTDDIIAIKLQGKGLANTERAWGVSNPFFEISARIQIAGSLVWHPVFRSEIVQSNLNPIWPEYLVPLERLLGDANNMNSPILVSVYHLSKKGGCKPMGSFETSVKDILTEDLSSPKLFTLMRKNKPRGEIYVVEAMLGGKDRLNDADECASLGQPDGVVGQSHRMPSDGLHSSSTSQVPSPYAVHGNFANDQILDSKSSLTSNLTDDDSCVEISLGDLPPPIAPPMMKPSFLDYISGSCELKLSIAIDFTGSNGDPRQPGTLHYVHPNGQLNDYEKAITAVGSIIAKYDSTKMHAVFGFGAKFEGEVRHCFQISNSLYLNGVAGVIDAYRSFFRRGITMSGPTVFAECIDYVAALARTELEIAERSNSQAYQILLILTDGAVTDIQQTRKSLENARDAPLSVVIVGIGGADFSAMKFLDEFQESVAGGRDICTFVEFSCFVDNRSALSKATLCQIPKQLVDYFYGKGILPFFSTEGGSNYAASDPDDCDIDLNLRIDTSGRMSFVNYQGAVFDDTKYDTASSLARRSKGYPSSLRLSSSQSAQGHVSDAPLRSSTSTTNALFYVQVPEGGYSGMQLQVENPATRQILLVTVPENVGPGDRFGIPLNLYHVQAPHDFNPGMQLCVHHPITRQMLLVTIPGGVQPGGWFSIPL